MTVYGTAKRRRLRPTLRMRLTLVNGVILGVVTATLTVAALLLGPRQWLLIAGLGVVCAAAGVGLGYLMVARALRPLQNVTAAAMRLSGETLDQRLHYAGPDDEVAELASTFDAMLDRLSGAFETQKRFVANASHELRTPLAVMRTEIDVTLSDPEADMAELRRMGVVVRDASERANALIESLLVLARSEAQAGRRLVRKIPADLGQGVPGALSAVKKEMSRLGLVVTTDLRPAPVVGDPSLLERLAGNLIENAVRYNTGQGRLWVRTEADATSARLIVGNTGFEVDQTDVPRLFEAFRRGHRDRTGSGRGAGLGLSIVRAVAEAHGGTVHANPVPGGGLEVVVTMPAAVTTPVASGSATVTGSNPALVAPTPPHGVRAIATPPRI